MLFSPKFHLQTIHKQACSSRAASLIAETKSIPSIPLTQLRNIVLEELLLFFLFCYRHKKNRPHNMSLIVSQTHHTHTCKHIPFHHHFNCHTQIYSGTQGSQTAKKRKGKKKPAMITDNPFNYSGSGKDSSEHLNINTHSHTHVHKQNFVAGPFRAQHTNRLWLRPEHPDHYAGFQNTTCTQFTRFSSVATWQHTPGACQILLLRASALQSAYDWHV